MESPKPNVDTLDSYFASSEKTVQETERAVKDHIARRQADDRSFIAKLIVWSFVILIVWVVVATTVGSYLFDWSELIEPTKYLMAILSSVLLPVVTLVIGYYFGADR